MVSPDRFKDIEARQKVRVEIVQVREPAHVEFLEDADRCEACGEAVAVHDDVVAAVAGQQFDVENLGRVVGIVIHLDAGLGLE